MAKGRRPLPTAVKKLRGNPGKRKLNAAEPKPKLVEPPMPANLTGLAVDEWKAIVPLLMDLGVLSQVDGKALAAYCETFAQWRRAMERVEELGILVEEPIIVGVGENAEVVGTKYKRNPAITIANDNLKLMKSFLVEFGLTPASRGRLKIEKPNEEADPMDAWLQAGAVPAAKSAVN